jgi:hypothetical protein
MRRAGRVFVELAREAFRDAMRRRIVPVIVLSALLSLLAVDSCTSCVGSSEIVKGSDRIAITDVAGWTGMLIFSALSLWTMLLAGLLASDHLAEAVADGSASLVLARPVRRSELALARLAGVLGIAFATGGVVLAASAYLLALRHALPLGAAAWAGLACAVSVALFVGAIAFANAFSLFGVSLGSFGHALQQFAPPLCSAVVVALQPWIAPLVPLVDPTVVALKLAFWVIASALILLAAFERCELAG